MANSRWVGDRPRMFSTAAYSSSVNPNARCRGSSPMIAHPTEGTGRLDDVAFIECMWFALLSMAAKKGPRSMTDEHKAALAEGRTQGRAVRNYLDAIEATKP